MQASMIILLSIFFIAATVRGSDDWSFLVIADWHGAENFAKKRNKAASYDAYIAILSHIKDNYGGELVILPGDTNT